MYRRMTLIGVLTAVASMLVFSIANALPTTPIGLQTAATTGSDTSISDTSMADTSLPDTSTAATSPSSTETGTLDSAVVGATTYVVEDAGSVTIDYDGSTLRLLSADANDSWTAFSEQTSGREIEVEFINGDRRVKFNAELEDGGIRVRVRDRMNDSTSTTANTTDTTLQDDTTDTSMITNTTIDDDDDGDDDSSNRGSDNDDDDDDGDNDDDDDDDDDDDSSGHGSDDDDDHGDDD